MERTDEKPRSGFLKIMMKIYDAIFCLVLTANLIVVLFDYTYLKKIPYSQAAFGATMTFRDVYLHLVREHEFLKILKHPQQDKYVLLYDEVKGIYPHRDTANAGYKDKKGLLKKYEELKKQLQEDGETVSPESTAIMDDMIDHIGKIISKKAPYQKTFSLARKEGMLEEIKERMRARYPNPSDSAKDSFALFLSPENLAADKRQAAFAHFEKDIRPLLEQNYYRDIGKDGELTDHFSSWIDMGLPMKHNPYFPYLLIFVPFFWLDLLIRWIAAIVTKKYRKWYLFPFRNWYDFFNVISLPYTPWLRFLRVISLYNRLKENGWLPGGGLMPGLVHDNAGVIAEEISGLVFVNIIDQVQSILASRDFSQMSVGESKTIGQVQEFANTNIEIISHNMVPAIQPDVTDLIEFAINKALAPYINSPVGMPLRVILNQVYSNMNDGLRAAMASPEGVEKLQAILKKAIDSILDQVTNKDNMAVMQKQIVNLLEAVKKEVNEAIQERA